MPGSRAGVSSSPVRSIISGALEAEDGTVVAFGLLVEVDVARSLVGEGGRVSRSDMMRTV